jgi:cell division protein FtsA
MARKKDTEIIVGIDVGTTKVAALAVRLDNKCQELLGMATIPIDSSIIEQGFLRSTIMNVVEKACNKAGRKAQRAYIGISGFLKSYTRISCSDIEYRVSQNDIQMLISSACPDIPKNLVMIEQVNRFYLNNNDEEGFDDPHGMEAEHLDVFSHTILASRALVNKMAAVANRLEGLISYKVTSSELAAASVLFGSEDKQHGSCLLDIGGEYASILIYHGGSLQHTASVQWGGNRLNDQIKLLIGRNVTKAEQAKIAYSQGEYTDERGELIRNLVDKELLILCSHLDTELCKTGLEKDLKAGIVLTGGTSKLPGLKETIEREFQMPVRMAQFSDQSWLEGVSLKYASAAGLALEGIGHHREWIASLKQRAVEGFNKG